MAERMLRHGLPRMKGGQPWPPATVVAIAAAEKPWVSADEPARSGAASTDAAGQRDLAAGIRLRRGLPLVAGGEAWPPDQPTWSPVGATTSQTLPRLTEQMSKAVSEAALQPSCFASEAAVAATAARPSTSVLVPGVELTRRHGLPRVKGGQPWPPAGTVASAVPGIEPGAVVANAPSVAAPPEPPGAGAQAVPLTASTRPDLSTPLPFTSTARPGGAGLPGTSAPRRSRFSRSWTRALAVLVGAAALGVLAGAAIAFVRTLLSFPFMQDFLATFPGEYEPGIAVAPGFAPWIGWQHFFTGFLMVLIIRSGLRVRTEKRPTVFWTPRGNQKDKISLTLWFHQSLDILWLVNGVIFVALLFVTGNWVRIVPTSWEVFPNALSAALQYVSFDWPHENGWNNYNSLQQLAYFTTVFLAAPLAAITGFRMSGLWPKRAERLSKAYPVEWARTLHFPIMLYFVAFIVAHVALVMLTGFLRNLNHMYASQDAVTWTGFWVFVVSLVVIAGAWVAARPLVLAPIAKAFGTVSGR
ncbi:cytochrome b/b6 domain-containing protein [Glaciibacter superstes]|uniref:cytochrome b/b6 domain-containing protein n=1 Tax=Glaciibacter superstes TaxID=501023 RepID=UPI0003B3ABC8|nr:cytochrome b/b6 domain-containing protein [Glaciibacter superstes]